MKLKLLSSLVIGAAVMVAGCSGYSPVAYTPPVTYTSQQMQTDAKIIGGVITLNKGEIALATLAQQKSANPAVRNFAAWMYKAHGQNLQQTEALSQKIGVTPVKGEIAMRLERKGRQAMATLKRLRGPAFDRAYMNAMVKGHVAALNLLNQRLIPLATNPLLKAQLVDTLRHVTEHLQKAQAIRAQLGR